MSSKKEISKIDSGLRSQCLSSTEVLAQSIANIAPSGGPAFGIALVFATAGNGTWLTYIFATIAVVLIGYHINQFARRSASPGALYTYVSQGLGPGAGFVSGWGLVLAYILTGCATLAAFSNFTNEFLSYFHLSVPPLVLCVIGILAAWYFVVKDIQLSAKLMLAMEGISLGLIFILGIIVLVKNGASIDTAQFQLKDVSFTSIRIGLVLAFFSFVGFESSTALGAEAKNPLKNIPKAVITSAVFVGLVFIIFSYIEVMGFSGSKEKLNEVPAALSFLADKNGVSFMGLFISLGAIISFWSCVVACMTACGRILMTMGRNKILHSSLAQTHEKNETPHIASTVISLITFIIPAIMVALKCSLMDIFGWVGTIATLGFLFSYAMIVLGVPVFLKKQKELKVKNVIIALITMAILMIPIVGSVYPLPAYPYNLFPFIFLGWLVVGGAWYAIANAKNSGLSAQVKKDVNIVSDKVAVQKGL